MFPIVVLRLLGPCQQVASLSHIASWGRINATDAWSALHDSSPQQKETQSPWDDLACKDSLAALLDTRSP